jgi:hypothetical protein
MEDLDNSKMDAALERLLKRASQPAIPEGAQERLMAVIRATEQQSNVVQLHRRTTFNRWAIGLPLAASLLLGIYLGTKDTFDGYLPDSVIGSTLAGAADSDVSTGLDEVEDYSDGELT